MSIIMNFKKIGILVIIFFVIFVLSIIFPILNLNNNNIFSNITINNVDVSGKSKEEAHSVLSYVIEEKSNSEIVLNYEDFTTTLKLSSLDVNYNLDKSISDAYNLGRTQNIFQNNIAIAKTLFFGQNFETNTTLNEVFFDNIVSDLSSKLPNKFIQNNYYVEDGNLIITRGTAGVVVDKDAFIQKLKNILNNFSSDTNSIDIPVKYIEPDEINLDEIHSNIYKKAEDAYFQIEPFKVFAEVVGVDFDVEKTKKFLAENPDSIEYSIGLTYTNPKTTTSDLKINIFSDVLGTFSTRYDASNKDRSNNLELAASKIDGTILAPGEEFSYNKIVGERSIAAGYKEAKIYVGGKIVDGLGGGICQVSSILYNAVVFADLEITERYNHQFITSYVEAGRDATVAYGTKDFKFINNRTYPIKINVSINSGIAKVDIYGIKEEKEYDISFETEIVQNLRYDTIYEKDSSLEPGTEIVKQKGINGVIVNVYKIKKQRGAVVSKELISKDTYNALDEIIYTNRNAKKLNRVNR